MTTATRSPMQRLLGAHLACVGAATGAVWGALGVCLADDGAARAALSGAAHGWGVPGGTVAPAGGAAAECGRARLPGRRAHPPRCGRAAADDA